MTTAKFPDDHSLNIDFMRSKKCYDAFGMILVAFILFALGRFMMIPGIAGWLLIAIAMIKLLELSSAVRKIRTFAFCLVSLFILDYIFKSILFLMNLNKSDFLLPVSVLDLLLKVIILALKIIVIWKFCGLIMDMAQASNEKKTRNYASIMRITYSTFILIFYIESTFMFLSVLASKEMTIAIYFSVSLLVFYFMIDLIREARKLCVAPVPL